jgi:parallel beta-helix repeat protein
MGVDNYSGPHQNETGGDGIGDVPYVIGADNVDHYPLMNPWSIVWTGTVYIKADGSIDPPAAPIVTYDNVTYTLTGDISSTTDGIVIERDGIIIKGENHTLHGRRGGFGIKVCGKNNLTIENMQIQEYSRGIYLYQSNIVTVSACSISSCGDGIWAESSTNITISFSNISNNKDIGIAIVGSNKNVFVNNVISNNGYGIWFATSRYNLLSSNAFEKDGIIFTGMSTPDTGTFKIDETNTVNGKPVYYWEGKNGGKIPEGAGLIILLDCSNIEISNQDVSESDIGIFLMRSNNNSIVNVTSNSHSLVGVIPIIIPSETAYLPTMDFMAFTYGPRDIMLYMRIILFQIERVELSFG